MHDDQPTPSIFGALWRYRMSSLAIAVVIVLVSLVVAVAAGDGRTARARIVLKTPDQAVALGLETTSESSFVRYVKQRALFVTSDRALNAARTELGAGAESLPELRDAVTAEASPSGESIEVAVDGRDLDRSLLIANAVVQAYREQSRTDVTAATDKALETLGGQRDRIVAEVPASGRDGTIGSAAGQTLSELDKQISRIRVSASQFGDGVSFVDSASAEGGGGPWRGVVRDGALGLVLGLMVAAAVAWFRADRDRRVRGADDLVRLVDESLLGEIEAAPDQAALHDPGAPPLNSYQLVATGLRTAVGTGVVVVTGPSAGSGTTTTTLQVASAAARDGLRVLVVDAAVRSRELSWMLRLGEWPGLTSIATGTASVDECTHAVQLGDGVVFSAVPAGNDYRHRPEQLRSAVLTQAIAEMRSRYDLVLVDQPPLASAPETASLIRVADGVVVTVRRDADLDAVRRLRDQLRLFGGTITGYVLTFAAPAARTAGNGAGAPVAQPTW